MRSLSLALVGLIIVGGAVASRIALEESAPRLRAEEWQSEGRANGEQLMSLRVALWPSHMDAVEQMATAVSMPGSTQYGKYLTHRELSALVKPEVESLFQFESWLVEAGVQAGRYEGHGDWYVVDATTVESVERLLGVEMHVYHPRGDVEQGLAVIRPAPGQEYTVPTSLANVVAYVSGMTRFPKVAGAAAFHAEPATPLPSGNAPVVARVVPGDKQLSAFFMPRCKDGSTTTDANTPCASTGDALSSVILAVSQVGAPDTQNGVHEAAPRSCKACSGWSQSLSLFTLCSAMTSKYGLPSSTVFCQSQAIGPVFNYVPVSVNISVSYSTPQDTSDVSIGHTVYAGQFVTPQVLATRYNIPQGLVGSASGSSMSVAEFLGQYYSNADLQQFFQQMGLGGQTAAVVGPNNESNPGGEASLDIQYLMGLARNISTVFWSVGGNNPYGQEPFDVWMTDVLGSASAPLVHSVSYGDDESSLSAAYMQRVNVEFQKAAVLGLSILFASGDNGVATSGPPGIGCPGHFEPSFPSSSPWVTAVGATQFSTQTSPVCGTDINGVAMICNAVGEIASSTETGSRISSGGGFSNTFSRPYYQEAVVQAYVDTVLASGGLSPVPSTWYNATGRAYPDVSACGRNYIVYIGGVPIPVDGTSAATPTFASVIALVNDARLRAGLSPLGFLNPALYAFGQESPNAFFDIVMGSNRCPEDLTLCCEYGLTAAPGFDLVTGFGTPNFPQLLANWLHL